MKFFTFLLLSALFVCALTTKPPKWDATYTVKGVLNIPYAEIAEPFEAWFDRVSNRSRIDYYGGTVKTYQLSHEGPYGTALKVAPVTTNEQLNKITCLQVNGSSDNRIEPQAILPNVKEYELAGTEDFLGYKCDKFTFEEAFGQKQNKYTLWVRYVKSPKYPASRQPIPVRYEMRGFNSLLGSHYDHYYLDYTSYVHDDIPDDIFEVNQDEPCVGFPGPGIDHIASFNPMKEFIHPISTSHVDTEFTRFLKKHNIVYDTNEEHHERYHTFTQNLRYVNSLNRAQLGFSLAINHLADKTPDEIKVLRGRRPSGVYNGGKPFPYDLAKEVKDLPDDYDWRLYGAVTPVKDQSVCGSCWSFGSSESIESAYFLHNGGNLVRLSAQALIDCSWGYGNNGCDGGEDFRAYQWIQKLGGIPTEDSYGGYLGQDGYCHANAPNVTLSAPITGWVNVTSGNSNAMKVALLKHGAISVGIDASHRTFSFYSHGVYFEPKCKNGEDDLDHAVVVVGFGLINGELYWLVKNSWSNLWGNDGYILMSARDNNCGVLTSATYVTF